ncbi:MAG: FAD-binding oxidoreductase, partial [Gammaproteobacteria bacterium]|nr:FAD-binding oxidoreductase [Gammaproteobacteria bacterium]
RAAGESGLALVPAGGRTGLSGGATASHGEVVVAFDRMNAIGEYNAADRLVECEAGVITRDLQMFAKKQGMFYPVDFASSGSSQIGGNIATNAGGIKVIRYGLTRDWVAGLTVVTGRGDLLELNRGLVKNATGYDLRHLFIGAEGTLGFIVKAQIRLTEMAKNPQVMLLGFNTIADLMAVPEIFRKELSVTAFEFFCDQGLRLVLDKTGGEPPLDGQIAYYGLLEFEAPCEGDCDRALELFAGCAEKGLVSDAVLAQSSQQAQQLWALRENMSEILSHFTPYKNDLSVQIARIPDFIRQTEALVQKHYADFRVIWFGHIGDGNLHLNILKPEAMAAADFKSRCEQVNADIFSLVRQFGGSISAEHGVGQQKRDFLQYSRSAEEIDMMRGIKAVFDPHNIMNPGKMLPL